jgi:hypothetical protein
MSNYIINLIGHPGVGKYTIAKELARRANARLVDNTTINNGIVSALPLQTKIDFNPWGHLKNVYLITYKAIEEIHKKYAQNYIFTNVWFENVKEHEEIFSGMEQLANHLQIPIYHFVLQCEDDEYYKRATSPQRTDRLKETDKNVLEHLFKHCRLLTPANAARIEISGFSAEQAAMHMIERIKP